jgi:hypothetical protein
MLKTYKYLIFITLLFLIGCKSYIDCSGYCKKREPIKKICVVELVEEREIKGE